LEELGTFIKKEHPVYDLFTSAETSKELMDYLDSVEVIVNVMLDQEGRYLSITTKVFEKYGVSQPGSISTGELRTC